MQEGGRAAMLLEGPKSESQSNNQMTSTEDTGILENCSRLLTDFEELDAFFQREGYLFFRELLDRSQMLRVKADFVRVLQQQGTVKSGAAEPVWTGVGAEHIDDDALYDLDSHREVWESSQVHSLMEKVFNEAVFMFRNIDIRFSLPSDERYLTPAHQDHFYIRQTPNFRTVWIPLMDIHREVGGLALARGSHKLGLLEHVEDEVAESYIFRGRKQKGIALDSIGEAWLTADYRPGDLLVFHSHTIHRALPNRSNKIRLSMDNRFQPLSEPRIWQAENTIPEMRKYRQEVMQMAEEEGADTELIESVLIEMMKLGLPAQQAHVKKMVAELGAEN